MTLKKPIALVTGASSGIGRAIAKKISENGYDIIICGRNKQQLEILMNELSKQTKVISLVFDIRNSKQVAQAFASLPNAWQDVDVLVNNAGCALGHTPLYEDDIADWDEMIDANVKGLLYMSKQVMSGMIKRRKGMIINMSSFAGKQVYTNGVVYCATKKAVEAISEGMRLELTPFGIKVLNLSPGLVYPTSFSLNRFKGNEEKVDNLYKGVKTITPEEVADVLLYAILAPAHVLIADVLLIASQQSTPTTIYRNI